MCRFRAASALALALTAGLLAACGKDDCAECQSAVLGTGGVDAVEPGRGGGGGAGGARPVQTTSDKWGLISFLSLEFGRNLFMQVNFDDEPRVLHPDCQVRSTDTCEIRLCPITETPIPESSPSVGLISVLSGDVVGQGWIQPDAKGAYSGGSYGFGDGVFFFGGGESLTFIGAGAEVPPFDVTTNYPAALSVVDPVGTEGLIPVNPTVGLTLTLGGGGEGDELFVYGREANPVDGVESTLICSFPTLLGSATLAPELVGLLPEGFPLTAYRMHRLQFAAGEYDVKIRVLGEVADATGTNAVSLVVSTPQP